ncbi:hypothetical protein BWI96_20845 [Siphonobacter sp. SORGH_AS_0500]|uniref:DNA/RNA non-specific endonuclease n=1 Tax=Siphonobacter sp. SORGH_AS_0500 TaxID=1864824 RepID=UPI000CBF320E|nr:hypothetical protein BWI96_20845 [Siphonobacter sp. SORGH_AS_0500]
MTKHLPTKSTLVILTLALTIWACKTVYPTEPIQESLLSDQILLGYPSYNTQTYVIIDHEKPLFKKQYVAAYLYKQGIPRWVGWHLQTSDLGDIDRQDDFRLDESLPSDAIKVRPTDYSGSGFDRGHVCPSG